MDEIEIINNIIKTKMKDSSGAFPPKELTHEDISKMTYEEYIGHDKGTMCFFFYSSGKVGNNKPFRLKNISIEDYIKLKAMISKNRDAGNIFALGSPIKADIVNSEPIKQDDSNKKSVKEPIFPTRSEPMSESTDDTHIPSKSVFEQMKEESEHKTKAEGSKNTESIFDTIPKQ